MRGDFIGALRCGLGFGIRLVLSEKTGEVCEELRKRMTMDGLLKSKFVQCGLQRERETNQCLASGSVSNQ